MIELKKQIEVKPILKLTAPNRKIMSRILRKEHVVAMKKAMKEIPQIRFTKDQLGEKAFLETKNKTVELWSALKMRGDQYSIIHDVMLFKTN